MPKEVIDLGALVTENLPEQVWLGKAKYALELAHKAVDIIDPYLPFVMTNLKDSEALRNIPGFDEIRKRLGYSNQIKKRK